MHDFDAWLIERLTLTGCLIYGDQTPDVHAALGLFQRSLGLPESFVADDLTVHFLRQQKSRDPDSRFVIFHPVPPRAGSRFVPQELAA
ncbi:hypothetical protein [Neorhizobium petrolearium]|uniref:hypothetical protein n=1 Tax=Neorhizobium petrolearium TaxID=515361 RepID=UPI003F802D90